MSFAMLAPAALFSAHVVPTSASSAASSGIRRRTPTIAAAWDCNSDRPSGDGNGFTERKKGEGRFRQAAQDRQAHPRVCRSLFPRFFPEPRAQRAS